MKRSTLVAAITAIAIAVIVPFALAQTSSRSGTEPPDAASRGYTAGPGGMGGYAQGQDAYSPGLMRGQIQGQGAYGPGAMSGPAQGQGGYGPGMMGGQVQGQGAYGPGAMGNYAQGQGVFGNGMMGGYGAGWMGGYGGFGILLLFGIVAIGLVMWVAKQKRK